MKTTLPPLVFALVVLTMAGCAQDKPGPSLSSDNPGERLQAVRQAQDKWGRQKHALTADRKDIVGRWNHPWSDAVYVLFNADGTFKDVGALKHTEGTYRLQPNDEIELTSPGIFAPNVRIGEYRLLGDTLEVKIYGQWVPYKRAAK
ncbi:MAG TPA: hypothetical protein VMF69_22620 [Gemmataceae bacterium]|nr:hypothetical protein [Gemmataceae bacterium]